MSSNKNNIGTERQKLVVEFADDSIGHSRNSGHSRPSTSSHHSAEAAFRRGASNLIGPRNDTADADASLNDPDSPGEYASLRVLPLKPIRHEEVTPADMATTFWQDATNFTPGSMPQSVVVGTSIGFVCGVVAFLYYWILEALLELLWHTIPEQYIDPYIPEQLQWLWIPVLGVVLAIGVGASVVWLGEPGDLSYTVQCVHDAGYIDMAHVLPMLAASQFSILGGGSLGPEAPLVAICAAVAGYMSRRLFRQTRRNIVRKHTLMGMACALAAFFGVPLGGSLFALEINNRFGIEYYEHTMEAIMSGTVCLCVFRALARLPLGAIWNITPDESGDGILLLPATGQGMLLLPSTGPVEVAIGAVIGLAGAAIAGLFAAIHQNAVMRLFKHWQLMDNTRAIPRALLGAAGMLLIGVLVPHTMFWGEEEFQTIATASPASELPHVYPTAGLLGFEMNSAATATVLGLAKILAISFTVAGGYRGGFIFPFFAAGAAFGKAVCFVIPSLSPVIACLSFAAGINVAITRTALATTLILGALSGQANAIPSILAASIASLFATSYMPFIRSQVKRADIGRIVDLPDVNMSTGGAASGPVVQQQPPAQGGTKYGSA